MAILFVVVARGTLFCSCCQGTTILAKHAWCGRNFLDVTEQILTKILKRFQTSYSSRAETAFPYAMNSKFSNVLTAQLKDHSENKGLDKEVETQAQVVKLKGILVKNTDLIKQRRERLELLIDKTENFVDSSVTFKAASRNPARAMCLKNLKLTVITVVSIVFIYIIVSTACGGFTWPNCMKR
uniref:Vesicle-associated membrane protein 7 n=1 Tax=Oryctolagus cuniculus TaxID=9986 RepID=A0A5F9DAS1_RABIT